MADHPVKTNVCAIVMHMQINYRFHETDLGLALFAGEEEVRFLHFGESKKKLLGSLRESFPEADLNEKKTAFQKEAGAITAHLKGKSAGMNFPIAVSGTEFQEAVWEYLRTIPPGTTQSYKAVAQGVGRPAAVRAVASACAKNNIAVAVPCHRVVRSDGSLSQYRWGKKRKKKLLETESNTFHE